MSRCFAYGRKYGLGSEHRDDVQAPWFKVADSVNGSACNSESLACSDMDALGVTRRYHSPERLATLVDVPADHWTKKPEMYCWEDYLWVLDHIPDPVVVTDPATVVDAWRRAPGG